MADTPFIEGAIYEKLVGDDIVRGTLLTSVKKPNGIKIGTMFSQGFAAEKVIEGGEVLNQWRCLHAEPIESLAALGALVIELKDRIEKLEKPAKPNRA